MKLCAAKKMQQSHISSKRKRQCFDVTLELELRRVLLRQTTSAMYSGKFCCQIKYKRHIKQGSVWGGVGQGEVSVFRDSNDLLERFSDSALAVAAEAVWTRPAAALPAKAAASFKCLIALLKLKLSGCKWQFCFSCCFLFFLFLAPNTFLRPP